VSLDALVDNLFDVLEDVPAGVGAFEHLAPLFVDDLALLVHHVVVLDDMLASVEMHAFDFFWAPAIDRATTDARSVPPRGCPSACRSGRAGPKIFIRSSSSEMKNLLEPGRPGGPRARGAGCRCAGSRGARCR